MELDLKNKHESEIKDLNSKIDLENTSPTPESIQKPPASKNKAKKRKERKLAELEAMQEEARQEAAQMQNPKEIEDTFINTILAQKSLRVHQIRPDGHCLYNSLAHQLKLQDPASNLEFRDLRKLAADHIRTHHADFLPFLVDQNGDMIDIGLFVDLIRWFRSVL